MFRALACLLPIALAAAQTAVAAPIPAILVECVVRPDGQRVCQENDAAVSPDGTIRVADRGEGMWMIHGGDFMMQFKSDTDGDGRVDLWREYMGAPDPAAPRCVSGEFRDRLANATGMFRLCAA